MISAKTQSDLNAVLSGNDISLAGPIAERAIARGESHEILFTIAAQIRRESGDHHGAVKLYQRAVALAPDNPQILTSAGDAMRYTGQLDKAIALFDQAIVLDKTMVSAWYGRALAFEAQGGFAEAEDSYIRVTELAPNLASGFAALATLQAQAGRIAVARTNAARAQHLGANEYETIMALAQCDIADGCYLSAVESLRLLIERPTLIAENAIIIHQLIGDSLDKLNLVDEAFASYKRANECFARLHAARNDGQIALKAVMSLDDGLSNLAKDDLKAATLPEQDKVMGHIFLLGYPRSGTTLMEQILATIPNVVTMEEGSTFSTAEKYMSAEGISKLTTLNDNDIDNIRKNYWDTVENSGIDYEGRVFVDMDPLKGSALPLIAKIFPNSRILIMHRDPRDVIWSCYRNNFIYSPVTYEFTSLHRAAVHFNALMTLINKCIVKFPLNIHIVKYENLVRDFDNTTREICEFLDLPWSSGLRDFSKSARTRVIRTASGSQVRRDLFDGSGQWRKYASHLEPIFPVLEPWIEPTALLRGT